MKVLVFTSLYPNNVWPEQGVFIKERMSKFALLQDCSVKVVAPVPYFPDLKFNWRWAFSQVAQMEARDGIEVYHPRYFMMPKLGMTLYGVMMFLSVLATIKRIREKFDFDLIDAHWIYPDGLAAVLLGRYFKKPVVVSARGSDINLYSQFPIIRRLLRYTLQKADRVIAVSQALKEAMVGLGIAESKISVIPNGVDTKKFYPIPRKEARESLGLPEHGKVILSVGHLTAGKGFDVLLKTVALLLQQSSHENLHLIIVGDGLFRKELEKTSSMLKLGRNVSFTGSVSHEELFRWYSAADVFCLASAMEGCPNVILESLACGTPVIATAVGGIPEIIRSDEFGLLTQRNETKIAEAIEAALRKSWRSYDLIQLGKQHSWEQTARAVHDVFESVLGGNTESPRRGKIRRAASRSELPSSTTT
jgi:glycosyltransferase involved in cell wall biosynthesis